MSAFKEDCIRFRPSLWFVLAFGIGGVLVSCSSSTGPLLTRWEGNLLPVFPSTVGGRVAAVTQFGRTEASIQIQEAEPEVTYGWRIDSGTCQEQGDLQGGTASYAPLTPGAGGTATADAVLAEVFRAKDTFAARVFLKESGEVVACGVLALVE